jgi:hypothetical protein
MATVYLAQDLRHRRKVALKFLNLGVAAALGPDRFLREIEIVAQLAHPHILPLYDSGEADGIVYYVMPYVQGESLRARLLREGRLPVDDALRIAAEVASALSYAHQQGVVHRDIKPENILLQAGHAVVADFGVAWAMSAAGATRATSPGIVVGTPRYMSPEQAAPDAHVDGRSDVYSLGCVLYEMLAGEPSLRGGRVEVGPGGGFFDSAPPLKTVRESVPGAVERAVARALARQPADRFRTADEFAAALVPARAASGRWRRFTSGRFSAGALAAAVTAIGVVAVLNARARHAGTSSSTRGDAALGFTTTSPLAAAQLRLGQERFWVWDLDGAAAAYRRAIAADSDLALAYDRLSVVETWRWDYPAARRTVEAGLARRDRLSPRWRQLLDAQRQYVMRNADSAIAGFQALVVDYPHLTDAWYGLGEALFHFSGLAGQSPLDAGPAFEHLVGLDSTFAPIYYHLVDLAAYRRDPVRAGAFLARMRADDPTRPAAEATIALTFGDSAARGRALLALRKADRSTLSFLVAHFGRGGFNMPLVDTLAGYLLQPDRTPDDRLRGAQYRLVTLIAERRWPEAVKGWEAAGNAERFDRWMVLAYLAGYPAKEIVDPMFAWARELLASGQIPDFTRAPWEAPRQAFRGLVHRAAVQGDSAEVLGLLRRLDRAAGRADLSDPEPPALRATLHARLALLAADTTGALRMLELSASRSAEPLGTFFPLMTMEPERWLLATLSAARGDRQRALRWLDSFANTWSFGDLLYLHQVACFRLRLEAGSGPPPTPAQSACAS